MYNGGGFYNQYVGTGHQVETAPCPTPKVRERVREPESVPRPMPQPQYRPRPPISVDTPSSGNHALIAQLGILAVIALFMFMKLNSS